MIEKTGVLFTERLESTNYSMLFSDGKIEHNVYDHDRTADGHFYVSLNGLMELYGLSTLWVHPDTLLSTWVTSNDFKLIHPMLKWFSPGTKEGAVEKPYCISLGTKEVNHVVMFPAYAHLKNSSHAINQAWDMPDAQTLMDSVMYVQRALDVTLKWTAAATALQLLKDIKRASDVRRPTSVSIKPMLYDRWGMVRSHTVTRPIWVQRDRDTKKQGLTDAQKELLFVLGGDKNAQFLGACVGIVLPSGEPTEVTNASAMAQLYAVERFPSLWEYELMDVSNSIFNSYDLYCPLSRRDNWASGELLRYCEQVGLSFQLKKGLVWREKAGAALSTWAEKIWFAISGLKNHTERFPDEIARMNALGTCKKMYVDVIGRFNDDFSKEYYQRAWNTLIIHRAIRNQMASFYARYRDHKILPSLVVNDAFYVCSDETHLNAAYPGITDHRTELRGYHQIGGCPLSDGIVQAFENSKPHHIEAIIKQEMEGFASATI